MSEIEGIAEAFNSSAEAQKTAIKLAQRLTQIVGEARATLEVNFGDTKHNKWGIVLPAEKGLVPTLVDVLQQLTGKLDAVIAERDAAIKIAADCHDDLFGRVPRSRATDHVKSEIAAIIAESN